MNKDIEVLIKKYTAKVRRADKDYEKARGKILARKINRYLDAWQEYKTKALKIDPHIFD